MRPVLFSSKTPIEVEVHGDDLRKLREYGDRAQAVMAAMPELADVETSLQSGAPEVQIVYDRDRLALYGLNIRDVARLVRDKVQGFEASKFNLKDRRIPIVVRLNMDDRETVEDIRGHHHQSRRRPADPSLRRGRGDPGRGTQRGAPHRRPARGADQREHRGGLAQRRDVEDRRSACNARSPGPPR